MNRPVIISLCDLTGHMTDPWLEAGYDVVLVDPQHGEDSAESVGSGATVTKLAKTVLEAGPFLGWVMRTRQVAAVFGFPPCTDMAVSGSRWFETKRAADPQFQSKAAIVAEQCRTIGEMSGAPYFVENPVSVLSSIFGKPTFTFNPFEFTAFEPADNYRKKTCLWAGGGFVMPAPQRDESLGEPDDRIHKAPPGPERANFRSATPRGFARAVFEANRGIALEAAA
jgi:hypothetical protein